MGLLLCSSVVVTVVVVTVVVVVVVLLAETASTDISPFYLTFRSKFLTAILLTFLKVGCYCFPSLILLPLRDFFLSDFGHLQVGLYQLGCYLTVIL